MVEGNFKVPRSGTEATSPAMTKISLKPYFHFSIYNKDPMRPKKLLLNKKEINKLVGLTSQKGYSLIPISIYFKGNFVKMELGIGKGKKIFDKREDLKKKEDERKIARYVK